jgi:hypothetical protein
VEVVAINYGVSLLRHLLSSTLQDSTQQADKEKKPPILVFLLKQGVLVGEAYFFKPNSFADLSRYLAAGPTKPAMKA